jgi:hypothetical protein
MLRAVPISIIQELYDGKRRMRRYEAERGAGQAQAITNAGSGASRRPPSQTII